MVAAPVAYSHIVKRIRKVAIQTEESAFDNTGRVDADPGFVATDASTRNMCENKVEDEAQPRKVATKLPIKNVMPTIGEATEQG
ncbi:hypothetical protein FRC06_001759 [Ceratobasidium sp. 370]|nr:hypothetical protein FRC06_001759 [Ceratobasidium sp. 370]